MYRSTSEQPFGNSQRRFTIQFSPSVPPIKDSTTGTGPPPVTTSYSKFTTPFSDRIPRQFTVSCVLPENHGLNFGNVYTRCPSKSQINGLFVFEYGGPHKFNGPPFQIVCTRPSSESNAACK